MGTFTFCFFGHSLDKSDSSYINEVFDFVNELNSQSNKIIVVYHNENSKSKLLVNLLSIRGKNDIEDLMKEEVLVFRNINSEELKRELGGGMFFL
jgi:archaellum biogenesis ATPase FlaH